MAGMRCRRETMERHGSRTVEGEAAGAGWERWRRHGAWATGGAKEALFVALLDGAFIIKKK